MTQKILKNVRKYFRAYELSLTTSLAGQRCYEYFTPVTNGPVAVASVKTALKLMLIKLHRKLTRYPGEKWLVAGVGNAYVLSK